MKQRLTPEMLISAYELLRTTTPFKGWHLPDPDYVHFRVGRFEHAGEYRHMGLDDPNGSHQITLSERSVNHLSTLTRIMAHEMIHLYQNISGRETRGQHNADFKKLAARVCRHHEFDPQLFC